MRKISKILVILVLMAIFTFGYVNVSKAEEVDYTGYEEVTDDLEGTPSTTGTTSTTGTPSTTGTSTTTGTSNTKQETAPETPKPAENKNVSNKATTPAPQAGSFQTTVTIVAGTIVLAVAGIGYVKYRKYNF